MPCHVALNPRHGQPDRPGRIVPIQIRFTTQKRIPKVEPSIIWLFEGLRAKAISPDPNKTGLEQEKNAEGYVRARAKKSAGNFGMIDYAWLATMGAAPASQHASTPPGCGCLGKRWLRGIG